VLKACEFFSIGCIFSLVQTFVQWLHASFVILERDFIWSTKYLDYLINPVSVLCITWLVGCMKITKSDSPCFNVFHQSVALTV
jgi:hypothetical protein